MELNNRQNQNSINALEGLIINGRARTKSQVRILDEIFLEKFHPDDDKPVNDVVLVDDDPLLNFLTSKMLLRVNPKVNLTCFNNPETALNFFEQPNTKKPDLLLVDINMPELNGWEFIERFSKIGLNCRVSIFTSSIDPIDVKKANAMKVVTGYITKPLDESKVRSMLGFWDQKTA